jgi:hypothetical protein
MFGEQPGAIDLINGSIIFKFDMKGYFNCNELEVKGNASTAKVVAVAPVVTAGPITFTPDVAGSCNATIHASAASAAGLPVTIEYIVDDTLVGSGTSATTTLSVGTQHQIWITGTDTNGMSQTITKTVTPQDMSLVCH